MCPVGGRVVFRLFNLDKNKVSYSIWCHFFSEWKEAYEFNLGETSRLVWYSLGSLGFDINLTKAEAAAANNITVPESDPDDELKYFFSFDGKSIVAHPLESFLFLVVETDNGPQIE